ncbi:MAG: ribosome maturation factor RimP [Salinisphaeraceae bacterium]|nr:ribosome maturation factor RimP [Salinisphaeraceae bacterium]
MMAPIVTSLGYELWHLEQSGKDNTALLRVYIDAPEGITLEDCERVSRELSAALDVEDPISGAFDLEVSSPGLDRPLVTAEHFRRFAGEQARFTLFAPIEGKRKFAAVIVAVDDNEVEVHVDGDRLQIAYSAIAKARLVPDFSQAGGRA